jgi:undecaprenyl-diphosphatase
MIEWLEVIDKQLFLWLNGFHNQTWDFIMWHASQTITWIPFYAILISALVRVTNPERIQWKNVLFLVLSVSLAILLADQISSGFFKPYFERWRPSHNPEFFGKIHLLQDENGQLYRGGVYGFVSSHAANTFAIAWFGLWFLRKRWWTVLLLLWASFVSYSRIYLGVHFPADILVGAFVGILSGMVAVALFDYLQKNWA